MPNQGQPRTGADRDAYFNQKIAALDAKVGLHDTNLAAIQSQNQYLLSQLTMLTRQLGELQAAQKSSTSP